MEEGMPNIKPERFEIEENKEEVIPRQGMQTRSQTPPSFWEKIQQKVYDSVGNLLSKRTGYMIPNMGEYGVFDVIVNLLSKATGNNKAFKSNFVNYAREVEKDLRSYATKDNMDL